MNKKRESNFINIFAMLFINIFAMFFFLFSLIFAPSAFTAGYPFFFPNDFVLLGYDGIGKDKISIKTAIAFSAWERKIREFPSPFDKTSYITTPRLISYYHNLASSGGIIVRDFDIIFRGQYSFSKSIFSYFEFFLRNRNFGTISAMGLGDFLLNFTFRAISSSSFEVFPSFGAVIPLAGEPDEQIATFQKVNISSFGVDIPLYLLGKFLAESSESAELNLFAGAGYIYRIPYNLFGQLISPGNIATFMLGSSLRLRNFFPTRSEIQHDLILSAFGNYNYGFPEVQESLLYYITGRSWSFLGIKTMLSGVIKRQVEVLGEKILQDRFIVTLDFVFNFDEKNFVFLAPDTIPRIPFVERVKPGLFFSLSGAILF